ncbi:MAG: hypothetical protein ABJH64_10675 [Algoriphagus sp.]
MNTHLLFRITIFFVLGITSCKSDYQKMVEKELSSGKQVDELFLGLKLGMTRKEFYETCWELNKEGVLTNGPTELSVEYDAALPSGNTAKMRFYPKFEDDQLYLMPVEFTYLGWAPWNEELSAENLRSDVVSLLQDWYNTEFIEVANEDKSLLAYVSVEGNRRVRIFKKHLSVVRVEIVDLKVLQKIEEEPS